MHFPPAGRFVDILLLLVIGFVCGCAQNVPVVTVAPVIPPSIDYSAPQYFGPPVPIESEEALFALSDSQRRDFLEFYNHFLRRNSSGYERVFDYLERETRAFNYESKTYTAAETLANLKGNCMSLAVLTTALASAVDEVEIRYQLVDSSPVFYKESDVVVKGVHVRSKLYERLGVSNNIYLTRSSLVVDYLPDDKTRFIGNISRDKFLALYYANRAVEFMASEKLSQAYWYARKALEYQPNDAANINIMAVIFRRSGNAAKAEEVYLYGLAVAENKLTLLKNYRLLLQAQGREVEVQDITQQMAEYDDPSPFGWLDAANFAYNNGEYQEAEVFYQKSIDAAPYLDYGYFGLAKVKYQKGELQGAKRLLIKAMENTFKEEGRELYQAKLSRLEKEI